MKASRVPPEPQEVRVQIEMTVEEARVLRAVAGSDVMVSALFRNYTLPTCTEVSVLCQSLFQALDTMTAEQTT